MFELGANEETPASGSKPTSAPSPALPQADETDLDSSGREPVDLRNLTCAVIDEEVLFRQLLCHFLQERMRLRVVVQVGGGLRGLAECRQLKPDLVFLSLRLVGLSGHDLAKALLADQPQVRIIALSPMASREMMAETIKMGVHGFVDKKGDFQQIEQAVQAVLSGHLFISGGRPTSREEGAPLLHHPKIALLSPRERMILTKVAEGLSNKEIAACLDLNVKTVEAHRARLCRKLDVHHVPGLTLLAAQTGLIAHE